MSKILAISSFLLAVTFASPLYATSCEIHTVKGFKGFSDQLRPDIEQILTKKGYKVIQDGYLYENYDVSEQELSVREDLLKNQNLIGIFNGDINYSDSTMCVKYMDGTISCAFKFYLFKVNSKKEIEQLAKVEKVIEKKPWLFGSEKKITDGFKADILEIAENNIPNCK